MESRQDEKSRRLYNLKLRYQGFRSYNLLVLVLLGIGDFFLVVLIAPFIGAVNAWREAVPDWWRTVRTVGSFIIDRYCSAERFALREERRRIALERKRREWDRLEFR